MGSKQQTVVEWLWDKLLEETETGELRYHLKHDVVKVFEEALQMNREQIEQAFIKGNEFVPKWKINGVPYIESEQYYEQTYGTSKSH
jgi:hypothetical protein